MIIMTVEPGPGGDVGLDVDTSLTSSKTTFTSIRSTSKTPQQPPKSGSKVIIPHCDV